VKKAYASGEDMLKCIPQATTTEKEVREYVDSHILQPSHWRDLTIALGLKVLSEKFFDDYANKIDWYHLTSFHGDKLSAKFIAKHRDRLDETWLARHNRLTQI